MLAAFTTSYATNQASLPCSVQRAADSSLPTAPINKKDLLGAHLPTLEEMKSTPTTISHTTDDGTFSLTSALLTLSADIEPSIGFLLEARSADGLIILKSLNPNDPDAQSAASNMFHDLRTCPLASAHYAGGHLLSKKQFISELCVLLALNKENPISVEDAEKSLDLLKEKNKKRDTIIKQEMWRHNNSAETALPRFIIYIVNNGIEQPIGFVRLGYPGKSVLDSPQFSAALTAHNIVLEGGIAEPAILIHHKYQKNRYGTLIQQLFLSTIIPVYKALKVSFGGDVPLSWIYTTASTTNTGSVKLIESLSNCKNLGEFPAYGVGKNHYLIPLPETALGTIKIIFPTTEEPDSTKT